MRRAALYRDRTGDQGTLGALVARDLALAIMEPPWRDNRRNRSCIPPGVYEVLPHVSPRFGRCLMVAAVPGRSHILFHAGNVGGDVERGWHTHTAGCLLPGLRRGRIAVKGRLQEAVVGSRTAFRHLMEWAAGEPFALEIVAPEGARGHVAPQGAREHVAPQGAREHVAPHGARESDHA